ncbi:PEP/pyruvate-binding domain-containing protein [Helicobacter sp.]|uniref:PEP/pyruvate-binding domain-containing protein n=1 Tax=Helicobacter sp. TaxID=218 RepID=UPI0025C5DE70|nr:PEP/pyruvate-binding domain-containing protein [Helicobacter sp.]MCI5967959.1 PEP-utilizing enzyme [Helicobacter sp.]MDY2585072.1 PEP/pyruvate-binding domain-containing protein [Helicobacter sp.]
MYRVNFISKARNLENLQGKLQSAKILPLVITNKISFQNNIQKVLKEVKNLQAKSVVVRSSSKVEDSKESSCAGKFKSLLNVEIAEQAITQAILEVGDSMPNLDDEILIQPMLESVLFCGVAFSVDKDSFAPYFCIEFDESGSTHSITDGSSKNKSSFFAHRDAEKVDDKNLEKVIKLIKELESIFDYTFLDIEFAITENGDLYCLQVRPLVKNAINLFYSLPKDALERLQKRFLRFQQPRVGVYGKKAVFGVMPDWNPAEMIGLKPKRLALSLYKEIITDETWAYQRDNYGYLKLRSHPLMYSFLGMPFVDVRLSFNSFIPKSLDENISSKLVDFYLNKLIENPHLHDKIEFGIVYSCYDLNTSNKLKNLLESGFNENEIKRLEFALLELTNAIISPKEGLYLKDLNKVNKLSNIYQEIITSNLSLIDKIYWLIEECKRYGTLPFAGVARAGFIAMQMLNSLVEIGFFAPEEKMQFLNSLQTISKKLSLKVQNLKPENKQEFLREFGHLRAGTYNILSPRYDEEFDKYFNFLEIKSEVIQESFTLSLQKEKHLDRILKEHGLKISAKDFFDFLKTAIEGREFAKFEFSKLLSKAISLIGELGEHYGILKEDIAHLDIKSILTLYSSLYSESPKQRLLNEIAQNKKEYQLTLALKLPALLKDASEIFSFYSLQNQPNFITQKSIIAGIAKENDTELEGKIVLIRAADPGYDYLFSKNIAGLITCYGGANSHMAIRASELGLPAAIGVGEELFVVLLNSERIELDCGSERIVCL